MNKKYLFPKIIAFAFCLSFIACEDVVEVSLDESPPQLVVDAWVNNQLKPQRIVLSKTVPYFESTPPPAVTGATVTITDDQGLVYPFTDEDDDGVYIWVPTDGVPFGAVGRSYVLSIKTAEGKEYTASSTMNRIMPVDSILYEEREEALGQPAGIYAEFYARDFPGEGDAYWIKTYKNGDFLNKPQEMNLAFDATYTPSGEADGIVFISPIRQAINRIADEAEGATDNDDLPPYTYGDSIYVEIHSLNRAAYHFLFLARTQMTQSDSGIFAEPPTNVPTNIVSLNATRPEEEALGFFNVAAVSGLGRRF